MMAKEAAGSLRIRLLGPFDVQVQGQPLPRLRSKKGPWLLTLLVLRQSQPIAREWLAETLWSDSLTEEALRNLRQSLNDLRKALGEQSSRLSAPTPRTLSLDLSGADVDVLRFDETVRCQDMAELEQAVALYRGPLLEGCSEVWILPEREARQQAYHRALQQLAAYALSGGDTTGAVRYLRQAVAVEPLWEEAVRSLMHALARSGDIYAALQVYQELVQRLRNYEPQALPNAATSRLYQDLRAQVRRRASASATESPRVPAPSFPLGSLPRPLMELVGREEDVRQVSALLRLSRLVTLTGTGGVGKTRLAIAVAELVGADQGVWLARLDQEHDNLRTALDWCTDDPQGAEIGLRFTGSLRVFWEARGFCDEGRKCGTVALLRKGAAKRTKARAKVLNGTGLFVWRQGDRAAAQEYLEESLSIGRESGDKESIANSLHSMAYVALDRGDHASAVACMEESLAKARELGNTRSIAYSLLFLGTASLNSQRDYAATRALCDEVLAIQTDLGDKQLLMHGLGLLGHVARAEEDYVQARMFFEQSLAVRRELGYRFEIAQSLEDFACLAARQEEYYRAARLLGAADALCEQRRLCHDGPTPPLHPAHHERHGEQSFSIRGGG